jgi:hypothetical protein
MRSRGVAMDPDLMMMRSDMVIGIVAGLLLAVVAMTLVLALGRSPSPPAADAAACDPDGGNSGLYARSAP